MHLCSDLVRRRARAHSLVPCGMLQQQQPEQHRLSSVIHSCAVVGFFACMQLTMMIIMMMHVAFDRGKLGWEGEWHGGRGNDSPVGINNDDIIVSLKSEVSDVSWALCTSSYPTMYLSVWACRNQWKVIESRVNVNLRALCLVFSKYTYCHSTYIDRLGLPQ